MKNYFGFSLTGSKLFPIWLLFYVLFVVPTVILEIKMNTDITAQPDLSALGIRYLFIFVLSLIQYLIMFFIAKILIENVQYNNLNVGFNGEFVKYIDVLLLGFFLTIITIGIYSPWFKKKLLSFYVDNSQLDNESFKFKGNGGELFLIVLFSVVLPIILLIVLLAIFGKSFLDLSPNMLTSAALGFTAIIVLVVLLIMVPFMYLYYKWLINIDYKNYNIKFDTKFFNSCGKILLESFLSIITIGIYSPMAWLRLYKYFTDRTVAQSNEAKRSLGFESNYWPDFFFIWGQLLLTIFTLGLYYPWMISEVGKRILSRTYLE
jgi:uncharacterized membrane protein YjgN (DUF898 family)